MKYVYKIIFLQKMKNIWNLMKNSSQKQNQKMEQ